jgi:hypothetical protein
VRGAKCAAVAGTDIGQHRQHQRTRRRLVRDYRGGGGCRARGGADAHLPVPKRDNAVTCAVDDQNRRAADIRRAVDLRRAEGACEHSATFAPCIGWWRHCERATAWDSAGRWATVVRVVGHSSVTLVLGMGPTPTPGVTACHRGLPLPALVSSVPQRYRVARRPTFGNMSPNIVNRK